MPCLTQCLLITSQQFYKIGALLNIFLIENFLVAERQSSHLLKATIPILDDEQCKRTYMNNSRGIENGFDSSTMICAGDLVEGKDTCMVS